MPTRLRDGDTTAGEGLSNTHVHVLSCLQLVSGRLAVMLLISLHQSLCDIPNLESFKQVTASEIPFQSSIDIM